MKEEKSFFGSMSEEELLEKRIADLPLRIDGTWLEECIEELYRELCAKGIKFRPLCYLADEWLTPDKEPVIGIPFYLAHPALIRLEKKMMCEAEGAGKKWCMRLLRHEAGHAINYAYRLYKKKKWQKLFGRFSQEYGDSYRFRPYSKNYVRHLEKHYAQYHPDEDFAETFAVWLTPDIVWKEEYKGWKALSKLEYVDSLMGEIGAREPTVKKGEKFWYHKKLKLKLKTYYKRKRDSWAEEFPDFHDKFLKSVFSEEADRTKKDTKAWRIINSNRKIILDSVAKCTGERKFIVNDLIKTLIKRCREAKLLCEGDHDKVLVQVTAYVSRMTMNYIYTGRFKG